MQASPIHASNYAHSIRSTAVGEQRLTHSEKHRRTCLAIRCLGLLFGLPVLSSTALAATSNVDVYGSITFGGFSAYDTTLFESGLGTRYAGLATPNLALNGAHHRSLLTLKNAQENAGSCMWGTADFSQSQDAHTYLAELGVCKDVGAARIGVGLGHTESALDRSLGGKSSSTGNYLIAEWASPVGRNLEASVTGLYGNFDAKHRRNYINGLAVDSSVGQADARSTALRLKLDWRDAATLGHHAISPYVAYSWSETKQDAYTEIGGGLPQSFASQTWQGRDIRIGAASRLALTANTELHLAASAIHVLSENSIEVTGSGFNLLGKIAASNRIGLSLDIDHHLAPRTVWSTGFGAASGLNSDNDWVWGVTTGIRADF